MTDPSAAREPVTLDEMIAWLQDWCGRHAMMPVPADMTVGPAIMRERQVFRRILATLQQHKRLEAVVEAAQEWSAARSGVIGQAAAGAVIDADAITRLSKAEADLRDLVATFDTAEPSEQGT